MALVTDQQETMFTEPEEAVASFQEELIHNEAAEAEDSASGFGSLDFPTEPEAVSEPVAAPLAAAAEASVPVAVPAEAASVAALEAPAASAAVEEHETAPVAVAEPAAEVPAAAIEAEVSVPVAAAPETAALEAAAAEEPAHAEAAEPAVAAGEPLPILTAADFSALEERVLRAVGLVRREREARIAAEERVLVLEGRVAALQVESNEGGKLKEEIESLRAEREQVRLRVERLLGQLDALEF